MTRDYFCVSIPMELSGYRKMHDFLSEPTINTIKSKLEPNVKINKTQKGEIESVEYFCMGNLNKKVYYKGSTISKIDYFKMNELKLTEEYYDELLVRKLRYENSEVASRTYFKYNADLKIIEIRKELDDEEYTVNYNYDDIGRTNYRKICHNKQVIIEQNYKFDILDRISSYSDGNQSIKVNRMDSNNKLISYTITDKIGNEIQVTNHFTEFSYVNTDVSLNGHQITVCDMSYVDNVMLKKPYTDEEDLDLIISNLMNQHSFGTSRTSAQDAFSRCSVDIIDSGIQNRTLPISIRKRVLYNMSLGL